MSGTKKILIVFAVIAGLIGMLIVGGLGLAWWGWGMFEEQTKISLNELPVIQEHIGEITEMDLDLIATGEAPDDDTFVFKITGTKGNGVVAAEVLASDTSNEAITSGTLTLPSGETYDLVSDPSANEEIEE